MDLKRTKKRLKCDDSWNLRPLKLLHNLIKPILFHCLVVITFFQFFFCCLLPYWEDIFVNLSVWPHMDNLTIHLTRRYVI